MDLPATTSPLMGSALVKRSTASPVAPGALGELAIAAGTAEVAAAAEPCSACARGRDEDQTEAAAPSASRTTSRATAMLQRRGRATLGTRAVSAVLEAARRLLRRWA